MNIASRLAAITGICFASTLLAQTLRRPLVINQSRYTVVAGERIPIEATSETVQFMRSSKTRIARTASRTFPVAPNIAGDQVLLGVPLTTEPGDYAISVSFTNDTGEERLTTLQVAVEPFVTPAAGSTVPPVVLLDGWQQPTSVSACPMSNDSTGTFGNLKSYLSGSPNFASAVYFFENCTECPNCTIEQLGARLGTFLNSVPVPQVDLVAHSMGGLIARSYLSGKQEASGAFGPPLTPKVRKAVFIGTPHFGSFQADSLLADIAFGLGNQTNEMKRGSQFIWDLATWNQHADDLRGTDALAIIGNAGSFATLAQASDGVVALTSASLDFSRLGRTRIVNYCHIPLSPGVEASYLGCTGPGIAYVDSLSHQTYQIVSSFLLDSASWQNIGTAPTQDPYLSKYGGIVVADLNSNDQYVSPSSVSWGSVALAAGAADYLYYSDLVYGTGTFAFGTSTCGPYSERIGFYSTVRCKLSPTVYSVGPLLTGTARVVQSGTTITITGVGFGAQQCGACGVTASNPQSTTLQIVAWSDSSIVAFLPANYAGISQIGVTTANGFDAINIMAFQPNPPAVALSQTSIQFAYTIGGALPSGEVVQVTNVGGSTLNWTASPSASWLSISPSSGKAPSTMTVSVVPTGLTAGIYQGTVQIAAVGTSNNPVTINVTLNVTAPPPLPTLSVVPQTLTFAYTIGATIPAAQGISITSTGGGTIHWTASANAPWLIVSPTSGAVPFFALVSVAPSGLAGGTYSGSVVVSAGSNQNINVGVTLNVTAAQMPVTIDTVVNGASFVAGYEPGSWVSIMGTNLATTMRNWRSDEIVNGQLPTSLDGTSVTINGLAAFVYYVSPTQLNVLAPSDGSITDGQSVPVRVTSPLGTATATAIAQLIAPAMFKIDAQYAAVINLDGTVVAPIGAFPGSHPAKPGDIVELYLTGLGPTNPAIPAGRLFFTVAPITNSISVEVGGVPASVPFAGLVTPGLYQVNLTVPEVGDGNQAITLLVGTVASQNSAVLAVQH